MLLDHRIPCFLILLAISMVLAGCVGPRVPSDRYLQDEISTGSHTAGGCSKQPFSGHRSHCDLEEEEPPKEIPWPMYHPIPTRPVFGSSSP